MLRYPPRRRCMGQPPRLKALIFDFDGTLAVPTLDFALMRRKMLESVSCYMEGRDIPLESDLPSMEELARITRLLPPAKVVRAREAAFAAIEAVEVEAASRSALFSFVRPMLAALRACDIGFGIITRNCPAAVLTVFPDVREHTACFLTRDDVPRVKPDPDHLLHALNLLGVRPEEAMTVGDHPMDIQVGKKVGAFTAGTASGESSLELLAAEKPDYLALDGKDLLRQLEILF